MNRREYVHTERWEADEYVVIVEGKGVVGATLSEAEAGVVKRWLATALDELGVVLAGWEPHPDGMWVDCGSEGCPEDVVAQWTGPKESAPSGFRLFRLNWGAVYQTAACPQHLPPGALP